MKISADEATKLVFEEHKEADKNLIRRKNQVGKNGEEALKEKLRKQELRQVEKQNKALKKAIEKDSSLDIANIKYYKPKGFAYGVISIDEYVSTLVKEIAEEDKNQQ